MGQKGSKYARKHQADLEPASQTPQPQQKIQNNLAEDDKIIWDILCTPYNFEKSFLSLPYSKQILMIITLNNIIKAQEKSPQSGAVAEFASLARKHLEKIHILADSHIDTGNFEPLSNDEKRLIRMDCYGKINSRQDHQLSSIYKFFSKPENKKRCRFSEYDLSSSPSWRVFQQFESFRNISFKLKCYLYRQHINPDALKVMTVNDFCDVIYKAFSDNITNGGACFVPQDKNVRSSLIKSFVKHCGKQMEQQLIFKGNDPRCVASLLNAMRRFGHCDIASLRVTETNYTPRVISDLKKAGYDMSDIKVGDKIAQTFMNKLIDEHKEDLILARDENGNLLDKSTLPNFEVHHKHAVQFSANNGYLARANYPHNLLLVDSQMHSKYYHLFDQVYKENKMSNYYSRLDVNNPVLISIIGFNERDSFYFDFENTEVFKKREENDKKYVVNYFREMEKRVENEIVIAEKYNITYAQKSSQIYINNLAQQLNDKSEAIQKFSKWLATQHPKNGGR